MAVGQASWSKICDFPRTRVYPGFRLSVCWIFFSCSAGRRAVCASDLRPFPLAMFLYPLAPFKKNNIVTGFVPLLRHA